MAGRISAEPCTAIRGLTRFPFLVYNISSAVCVMGEQEQAGSARPPRWLWPAKGQSEMSITKADVPPAKFDRHHYVSLGEFAYSQLRESIQTGKLRPGSRVREKEVADWLQIIRTPVREALRRLEVDGRSEEHTSELQSLMRHP